MLNIQSFFQNLTSKKPARVISARNLDVRLNRTFNDITLYDLLLNYTLNEASRKVTIRIGSESAVGTESAVIFIVRGKIINAEYRDFVDELAVMEIFKAIEQTNKAKYKVKRLSEQASSSTAIQTGMDVLLFKVAMLLDKEREALN